MLPALGTLPLQFHIVSHFLIPKPPNSHLYHIKYQQCSKTNNDLCFSTSTSCPPLFLVPSLYLISITRSVLLSLLNRRGNHLFKVPQLAVLAARIWAKAFLFRFAIFPFSFIVMPFYLLPVISPLSALSPLRVLKYHSLRYSLLKKYSHSIAFPQP